MYVVFALSPALSSADETKYALIPSGTYAPLFGEPPPSKEPLSAKKKPLPPVGVDAFLLSRFLVTKRDFLGFVRYQSRWQRSKVRPLFADRGYLASWRGDLDPDGSLEQPVTEVSWFAANAFCKSQNARLPTTSEWEYVARASETKLDAQDDDNFVARILGWYSRHGTELQEVGRWKNIYGVSDMHGLVWEWVSDFNSALITGESRSDARNERNLFCAGGAMFASEQQKRNYAAFMRFAFRSSLEGAFSLPQLGFRCAKDIPGKGSKS